MKINQLRAILALTICCCFISTTVSAIKIQAAKDGNWTDPTAWNLGRIPISTDSVFIDGYTITIEDAMATVAYIAVTNNSGDVGELVCSGTSIVNITKDLQLLAIESDDDVLLKVIDFAVVNIGEDLYANRNNSYDKKLDITIENSAKITVNGNLTYLYVTGSTGETHKEIHIKDNGELIVNGYVDVDLQAGGDFGVLVNNQGKLTVQGNVDVDASGGKTVYFKSQSTAQIIVNGDGTFNNTGLSDHLYLWPGYSGDGNIRFGGSLTLVSGSAGKIVMIEAANDAQFEVDGNITLDADAPDNAIIELKNNSMLKMGGNLKRLNSYGKMIMSSNATFMLDGSGAQEIPDPNKAGSSTDSLQINNLTIEGAAGRVLTLMDDLFVKDHLQLTTGIIKSSATAKLIIEHDATISPGSSTVYVEGPIEKRGQSPNATFLFPTGHNNTYAPLEISSLTDEHSAYTAEYFTCPPPYGTSLTGGLNHISGTEFWDLAATSGTEQVQVTLHWMDGPNQGILDTASLVVSGYVDGTGWVSFGRENLSVNNANYDQGQLSNFVSCPPPYGTSRFTFGSTSTLNALPVVLNRFEAMQDERSIIVKWETESEMDIDQFIIEKSLDGIRFEEIYTTSPRGNQQSGSTYQTIDYQISEGKNCYRLVTVNLDGSTEVSPIVAVNVSFGRKTAKVFPNPVSGRMFLTDLSLPDGPVNIAIFDQQGRQVYQANLDIMAAQLLIPASITDSWQQGFYTIRLKSGSKSNASKFFKM